MIIYRNIKILFVIFCMWLLLPLVLCARDFPMRHYTVDDGLPSNNVYSTYRDSKGYLWFATDKGIARYNGVKFETYTTSNGMPDNEVFFFREDYQGRLWLGTYNGELCFYKDGVFHTAANTSYLKMPVRETHIYNISVESDSSVTFNFYDLHTVANIKGEHLQVITFANVASSSGCGYISYKRKLSDGTYEIYYEDYIDRVDTAGNTLGGRQRKWPGVSVYVQVQDTGYFVNAPSFLQDNFPRYDGCVLSRSLDSIDTYRGRLTKGKLLRAYYTDGVVRFFASSNGVLINDSIELLRGADASSVTQDAAGNYWISTLNSGAYKISKDFLYSSVFKNVYKQKINFAQATSAGVFYVPENKNLYKLANGKRDCVFDYEHFSVGRNLYTEDAYYIDPMAKVYINFKSIECIVHRLDKGNTTIYKYRRDEERYAGVRSVLVEGDRLFLIGRSDVCAFNYQSVIAGTGKYKYLFDAQKQRIYGINFSAAYGIWVSTATSTYRLLRDSAYLLPQYRNIAFRSFAFIGDKIVGCTQGNDLIVVRNILSATVIDTMPQQNCVWGKVYPLDSTHVLLGANSSYFVLAFLDDGRYDVYPVENMFVPQQADEVCIDTTLCYFFKSGSIIAIPKVTVLAKSVPPRLYFTGVKTMKGEYRNNIDFKDCELAITYAEARNMTISISSVLVSGQNALQQYSISHDDQDNWRDLQGDNINLVNPGYGDYKVKVRAKTRSSEYCEPVALSLIIYRPFWATWWFILMSIVAAAGIAILFFRGRLAYMVHKNERAHQNEMKFVKSEYKALNALMNPHFVFNTLNNVQGLVNRDDKLAANEYIRVFADLIRQNMHNLSKEMIPLSKEMELVVNYLLLEKLRFKDLLNYSIKVDNDLDLSEIMVPPLLVQPLVENSIKHGILPLESIEGVVNIRIYERNNILSIEVRDNGIGPTKAKESQHDAIHESFAMGNIKKRIEQLGVILGKEIKLEMKEEKNENNVGQWTVVTISMHL